MDIGTIIIYGLIGFVLFIGLLVGLFFFLKKKGGPKHPFILYSLDGSRMRIVEGVVKKDPENPNRQKFFFKDVDASLDIRPPTTWLNNVPHREIIYNDLGELSYVNSEFKDKELKVPVPKKEYDKDGNVTWVTETKIEKTKYKELAIEPEEKALALHRYKESMKRYENPMNKAQAAMLIGGFILVLLIGIGVIYSTITYSNLIKDHVVVVEKSSQIAADNKAVANTNQAVTEQLAQILAALTNNANITRTIS